MEEKQYLEPFKKEIVLNEYSFYFDEDIVEPDYYRVLSEILISSDENDVVNMYFSSCGGNSDGMVSILAAMSMCKAHINGILVGNAMSAASAIFLHCDSYLVGNHATMMIHTATHSYVGKNNEISSYYNMSQSWIDSFLENTYGNFLTTEELNKVKEGGDLYFNAEQIINKLALMSENARGDDSIKKEVTLQ